LRAVNAEPSRNIAAAAAIGQKIGNAGVLADVAAGAAVSVSLEFIEFLTTWNMKGKTRARDARRSSALPPRRIARHARGRDVCVLRCVCIDLPIRTAIGHRTPGATIGATILVRNRKRSLDRRQSFQVKSR